jgi:hypothetical protein
MSLKCCGAIVLLFGTMLFVFSHRQHTFDAYMAAGTMLEMK